MPEKRKQERGGGGEEEERRRGFSSLSERRHECCSRKLSSSRSTSSLASRMRRHSHKKNFLFSYRQGLIQSCAGETPLRPSPSPSPELAESEMSMARERKQLGGGGLLEKKEDIAIVVERLFSNLNEATLEHEPGSLSSAVLLIEGTTVSWPFLQSHKSLDFWHQLSHV